MEGEGEGRGEGGFLFLQDLAPRPPALSNFAWFQFSSCSPGLEERCRLTKSLTAGLLTMLAETLLLSSASWSAFLIFQQVESEQIFYLLLAGNRNKNQTEEESRHGSFLSRESQYGILNYFFLYFFSSFSFLKFPNRAALLFLSAQVISV